MGFYPALEDGAVKLKSILQKSDMGTYSVILGGISTVLEVIGVTAWLGFLIQVVLTVIIMINLPGALKDAISKYLANAEWVLFNFKNVLQLIDNGRSSPLETDFDVDTNSMLVSIDYSKGYRPEQIG
jgi:hypothetical protein